MNSPHEMKTQLEASVNGRRAETAALITTDVIRAAIDAARTGSCNGFTYDQSAYWVGPRANAAAFALFLARGIHRDADCDANAARPVSRRKAWLLPAAEEVASDLREAWAAANDEGAALDEIAALVAE